MEGRRKFNGGRKAGDDRRPWSEATESQRLLFAAEIAGIAFHDGSLTVVKALATRLFPFSPLDPAPAVIVTAALRFPLDRKSVV